ncbi:MAG: LPXTG cell wall anchor domain-containing protein [Microbacterium sp.]
MPICVAEVPWISYSLTLVDTQTTSAAAEAVLTVESGTESTTIALGTITEGTPLAGRVVWPTAMVGTITATADAGATLVASLSYPECDPSAAVTGSSAALTASLPDTGGTSASTIAVLVVAVGASALGIALVRARGRRARSDAS